MLTARIQAIDGTGTLTPLDSQPCRLLRGPVDYFIFYPDSHAEKVTLGTDLAAGQRPVVAVPGGCWKALRLHDGVSYALMANTLSPEFTPDRVTIGAGRLGETLRKFRALGDPRVLAQIGRPQLMGARLITNQFLNNYAVNG
jgi:hypothetical protein